MTIARRSALLSGVHLLLGGGVAALASACSRAGAATAAGQEHFEVEMTDDQWKAKLSPQAYAVLRHEGTEAPFTSPLNDEHRKGMFICAGCALAAVLVQDQVRQRHRLAQLLAAAGQRRERARRQLAGHDAHEVHCRRCGGHLGHVFDDGPKPTGLRYCMNGVAMAFTPA